MKKFLIISSIILTLIIGGTLVSIAQESTPAFTISGVFSYEAQQGSTIKDTIELKNLDEERKITITLAFKEDIPKKPEQRTAKIPDEWLSFKKTEIVLAPLETKSLNLFINIPEHAEIKTYNSVAQATLIDYKTKETETNSISVNVAVARSVNLNVTKKDQEAKITETNINKNQTEITTEPEMSNFEKIRQIGSNIYKTIQANLEIVLLLIIIALLLKISIIKKTKKGKK